MRAPEDQVDPDSIPTRRGGTPASNGNPMVAVPLASGGVPAASAQIDADWAAEAARDSAQRPVAGTNLGIRPMGVSAALANPAASIFDPRAQLAQQSLIDSWTENIARNVATPFATIAESAAQQEAEGGLLGAAVGFAADRVQNSALVPGGAALPGALALFNAAPDIVTDVTTRPALAAMQAVDYVWENVVAEPLSAAWIYTNFESPAFLNWEQSRKRADDVSWGNAVFANPLTGMGLIASAAFGIGPWADDVDYTDPKVVKQMSKDYLAYKLLTGATDFALNVMPIPGTGPMRAAAGALGLSTRVTKVKYFATIRDDIARGLAFERSGGLEGNATNTWKLLKEMADATEVRVLEENPLIARLSGAPRTKLVHAAQQTNDTELLGEMYLASIGDHQAAANLLKVGATDYLYAVGNVGDQFRMKYLSPKDWKLTPQQEAMRERAFADDITRNEFTRTIVSTFFNYADEGAGEMAVLGNWMPMTGVSTVDNPIMNAVAKVTNLAIAKPAEAARRTAYRTRTAVSTGDASRLPGIMEKMVQTVPGGPTIRLINVPMGALRWTLSERPIQSLVFSGTRPDDVMYEAHAVLNSVAELAPGKMFPHPTLREVGEDGLERAVMVPAETLIRQWETNLATAMSRGFGDAGSAGVRVIEAWRKMEDDIIKGLATLQDLDDAVAAQIVEGVRDKAGYHWQSLKSKGHFADEADTSNLFHPRVIAELADHEYTLPLAEIAKQLRLHEHAIKKGVIGGVDSALRGLEIVQAVWRTSMLLKPGYTFRNSMFEPGISMLIAQAPLMFTAPGLRMLGKGIINFNRNNIRRLNRATLGSVDRVNAVVSRNRFEHIRDQYVQYKRAQDQLNAELAGYEGLDAPSIALRKQGALDDLREVEDQLRFLGQYLTDSGASLDDLLKFDNHTYTGMSRFIKDITETASGNETALTKAREALAALQKKAAKAPDDARLAAQIDALDERVTLMEAVNALRLDAARSKELSEVLDMTKGLRRELDDLNQIITFDPESAQAQLAAINKSLESITPRFDAAVAKRAEIAARRQKRSTPYLQGEGQFTTKIRGQRVTTGDVFYGPNGDAFRAEASSAMTQRQNFDPTGNIHGRTFIGTVLPTDTNYFDELYVVVSRHFAGDSLFQRMLTQPREKVLEWMNSRVGRNYLKNLGPMGERYADTDLEAAYDILFRLLPTEQSRALVASGEKFTAGDLAKAVTAQNADGSRPVLEAINGAEIMPFVSHTGVSFVRAALDRTLQGMWQYIAVQPETRLARWPFYVREFRKEWTDRMNLIAAQGIDVTDVAVGNAQRQASRRAALESLEKTFYTVRRMKNPVYSMRYVTSFPQAFFNSLYRYLYYLPTRRPGNMLATTNVANSVISSISVDEEGNQVSISKAKYLVIPMTGDGTLENPGVRVPLDALTRIFVDNPSRSWLMAVGVDTLSNRWPSVYTFVEENFPGLLADFVLGEFHSPAEGDLWDVFANSMKPNYLKTIETWWRGEGSEEYKMYQDWAWRDADAQRAKQRDALEAAGEPIPDWLQGPPDLERDVRPVLDGWFLTRFGVQFAAPVAYQTDAPGQMERDIWQRVRDDYPQLSYRDQQEKYREIMGGDWADPYTASSTKDPYGYRGNMSQEALDVLQAYPDLAKKLGSRSPELIGLLLMGDRGTYSKVVANYLRLNGPYEGAEVTSRRMTAQELEQQWWVSQGWDEYNTQKERYLAALAVAETMPTPEQVKEYRDRADYWWKFYLKNEDESAGPLGLGVRNRDWLASQDSNDSMRVTVATSILDIMDSSFWDEKGSDPQWALLAQMVAKREELINLKAQVTSEWLKANGIDMSVNDYKGWLEGIYTDYYAEQAAIPENSGFRDIWDRYGFDTEFISDADRVDELVGAQQ